MRSPAITWPRSAPLRGANRVRRTSASPSRPRLCGASSASASSRWRCWCCWVRSRASAGARLPAMGDNVIEVRGLLKLYGATRAVDAIDLDIRRGEIFGLLGPNGAGKTTTILMLLGLTEVSGGTVDVLGFDPVRQPLEVKRRVGYLPDAVGFYDHLTARENLRYTARLLAIPRRDAEKRISDAMESVQLADVLDKRVSTFSRGMRQRLGIAEIVMKKAEVAILDEPTSGLDPPATQVRGAGHPILVEASGVDIAGALRGVEGVQTVVAEGEGGWRVVADRDVRAAVAQRIVSSGGSLTRLADLQPSLEEVYTRYFEEARHVA